MKKTERLVPTSLRESVRQREEKAGNWNFENERKGEGSVCIFLFFRTKGEGSVGFSTQGRERTRKIKRSSSTVDYDTTS